MIKQGVRQFQEVCVCVRPGGGGGGEEGVVSGDAMKSNLILSNSFDEPEPSLQSQKMLRITLW